ncbi:hypothetical protein NSA50_19505 [Clostridium sp. DSM 100503]|nr:hypothetical protein [Clostridium sp. DSM 100503]MCR1953175.1 hypothetical protein [Clostridium sp. DSM 100503]
MKITLKKQEETRVQRIVEFVKSLNEQEQKAFECFISGVNLGKGMKH